MAGRGTDIKLGGANNDDIRQREEVLRISGLVVLGSERHESRRIDNQLRGRSEDKEIQGSHNFLFPWKTN